MTTSTVATNKLAQKIADVIVDAEVKPDAVFDALVQVFAFWMSYLCDDCRQATARKLRASIPIMLETARQAASSDDELPGCTPTSH